MEASNYNKQAIETIVLSCKHTEKDTEKAIAEYIAERNLMYGKFSVGNMQIRVTLEHHYDESTSDIIDDDWLTSVIVGIEDDVIQVTFD